MKLLRGSILIIIFSICLCNSTNIFAKNIGIVKSASGLFVREKNSSKSEKIGSLKNDEQVLIISQTGNWYKIHFETIDGKKKGFVLKKYILANSKKIKKMKTKNKKTKNKKKNERKVANTEKKIENNKNKNSKNVKKNNKKNKKDEIKNVEEIDDNDKKITQKSAPKNKKNKKHSKIETKSSITGKHYQSIIVGAELLNVRTKNNKKSDIIATVRGGETYPIVSETKNWIKIALTATAYGYVMREYVDFSVMESSNGMELSQNSRENENDDTTDDGQIVKEPENILHAYDMQFNALSGKLAVSNVPAVNVRKDTNIESPIMAMLLEKGKLEATGEANEWVRVNVDDNVGYIMKKYVDIIDGILTVDTPQDDITDTKIVKSDDKIEKPNSIDGDAVVKFARQFLGNPYVWGGTSLTKGTDCSGFVQSIYKYFGYNLKRTSAQQRHEGIEITSLSEALPGDLICYDGHIGIFMGQEKGIIHASNPRAGIIVTSEPSYRPILAIRRIIH